MQAPEDRGRKGGGRRGRRVKKAGTQGKQAATCAECGANFFLEEAPNVKRVFRRGFRKRKGMFGNKALFNSSPH